MPLKKVTTESFENSKVTAKEVRDFLEMEDPDLLYFMDSVESVFGKCRVVELKHEGQNVVDLIKKNRSFYEEI